MTPRLTNRDALLPRFSLERRVTVLVLFLATVVVGAVATFGIPVELIPRGFQEPFLRVYVPWNDAHPAEVLDKVTRPLEEELGTVAGLQDLRSYSYNGRSIVAINFKQGTDMDVAYREVRDRIERARRLFPDDVERVFIHKHDDSGIPVLVLGVAVEEDIVGLYDLVETRIVRPLQRVDGVANVQLDGLEEKEILIELDRDRAAAAGINIWQLAQRLGDDNFALASGRVIEGSRRLLLRSVARFRSLEDLQRLPVAPDVRLGEIATLSYDEAEKDYRARAMSRPAFAVVIQKEGDANTREVSRRVAGVIEKLKHDPRLAQLDVMSLFSQGDVIDESLQTLLGSGLIGGIIAGVVLFFFLRRTRMMIVVAAAIPLSLVCALTVMFFAGETINILSLLGLMICVGLLVDNAVVVAENIHRLAREGMAPREAAVQGASEIALAITMSTLTTIIVFLPAALVEGPARFFLLRMAIPVCVALVASLLIALVFVPLCVYLTLDRPGRTPRQGPLARGYRGMIGSVGWLYGQTVERLGRGYGKVLDRATGPWPGRPVLVLCVAGLIALTIAVPGQQIEFVGSQEEEAGGVRIEVELPETNTLADTEEWFLAAEKVVEAHAEEMAFEGWFLMHRKTRGRVEAWFTRPRPRDVDPRDVRERLLELLPERPGVELYTGEESQVDSAAKETLHVVRLVGDDATQLDRVARDLEDVVAAVPGVVGLQKDSFDTPSELGLVVDRTRARHYGVDPRVVAGVVGYALRGANLPRFSHDGVEVPVRVRFQEEDRASLQQLSSFELPAADGRMLPLSAVTTPRKLVSPQGIFRENGRTSRTITAELAEGTEKETRARIVARLQRIDLPEGISLGANRERQQTDEDLAGMRFALLLSVVFIYLLMGFLFESFVLPLSILLTIPLAGIGVWWMHFAAGRDIDFLGVVGLVLLVGVVVNNGIVLVDTANRLRATGIARRAAVRTAAERRFRPIMMTAITTIGGMIPLALAGASSIGLSYTSFALSLIGGLTTATLLTLLVVPVFYTLFDDLREWVLAATRAALAVGRRGAGANVRGGYRPA
jgi:HAE1 family hydrophobic/amphiphilic exporter-1